MSKSWLKKFNKSVFKKKTPVLGFTVLELFILFIVISGGTTAIVINRYQQPPKLDTNTNLPTYEIDTSKATTPIINAEPQNSTQDYSQSSTINAESSSNDAWLEKHNKQMEELQKKQAEEERCRGLERTANNKYSAAIDRAKAAYDAVMAEWNQVKNLPYYQRHPYEQYANDAKTKHNAISKPAYAEYVATLNSIRSQGCEVIQLHSDYSWVGY